MIAVVLKPGRDRSLRRRHPWLLSGAIARVDGAAAAGELVRVLDVAGEVVGYGHLSPNANIRVRMLSFGKEEPPESLLSDRIAAAVARRTGHPMISGCEALRLVNGEADGLPGLVVDRYADVVVLRIGTAGMARRRDELVAAVRRATGAATGYERADASAARREGFAAQQGTLWGAALPDVVWFREGERRYAVKIADAQQTGFYLAHRDSRDLVQQIADGRRVLDLFSYSGGFSVAAARGGARSATLVESSADALALARQNLDDNAPGFAARFEKADVFQFVRRDTSSYDLIVVDPPALARTGRDLRKATRAYKDVLLFALKRAAPGALLLTFSSSRHVDASLFRKITFGAALDAGREVAVLRTLSEAADHPVSIYHPEGVLLTGLLLEA